MELSREELDRALGLSDSDDAGRHLIGTKQVLASLLGDDRFALELADDVTASAACEHS